MSEALNPGDVQALQYLYMHGPDVMPKRIESEEQMCAALVFIGLKRRGLVLQTIGPDTLRWDITPKGRELLFDEISA